MRSQAIDRSPSRPAAAGARDRDATHPIRGIRLRRGAAAIGNDPAPIGTTTNQ
jgi:hypothetical protein